MTYIRVLEADNKSKLEDLANNFLNGIRGKVRGYSIHPTTGKYTCLIEFTGENPNNGQRDLEPQEQKTLESEVMLTLICRNDFSSGEFQEQYGISDCEAVRKYHLYDKVIGTEAGKRVTLDDIKTNGYKKAAEMQQLELRKFKEVNGISWKELADLYNLPKCPIDYNLLAQNLGLNLDDICDIDRRVRYALKKKKRSPKPIIAFS
ncbi:hypothetical protein HQ489_00310 [Candidatus Woesearchaeota archaeon]|nr:hypothetical protein [Candidatus Woesearchaeota archaeon]